jgi:N-acylneuraminate cytidylyltransferase
MGLPGNNIRPFAGRPLIAHTIDHALACRSIGGVYVSTDDARIAAAAREAGATVPFLRPAELATDDAGKLPVIEHLVAHLETQGERIARVVDLQPTSPLREASDIDAALAVSGRADAPGLVVSVREAADNPYFTLVEPGADGLVHLSKGSGSVRRQDTPAVYALNGSIYVWRRECLAHAVRHGLWSVRIAMSAMPRWRSVDIDDLDDFDYAEWLYARHSAGGKA